MLSLLKPVSLKKDRQIRVVRMETLAEAVQIFDLPRDAHVVSLAITSEDICMILEVRPEQENVKHAFALYMPGQWIAAGAAYVTSLVREGMSIHSSWHLYRLAVPPLTLEKKAS